MIAAASSSLICIFFYKPKKSHFLNVLSNSLMQEFTSIVTLSSLVVTSVAAFPSSISPSTSLRKRVQCQCVPMPSKSSMHELVRILTASFSTIPRGVVMSMRCVLVLSNSLMQELIHSFTLSSLKLFVTSGAAFPSSMSPPANELTNARVNTSLPLLLTSGAAFPCLPVSSPSSD